MQKVNTRYEWNDRKLDYYKNTHRIAFLEKLEAL